MTDHNAGTAWKAILSLCDEVEDLRTRQREGLEIGSRTELRRRRGELRGLLDKELRNGSLSDLCGEQKLKINEAEILVTLLRQYVDPQSPCLTGRELLDRLADDTFTKLSAIGLLASNSILRSSGIVTVEREKNSRENPGRPHDPLDLRFKLSDLAASLFYDAPDETPQPKKAPREARPYQSNREYLLDLRTLSEFCRRRAQALFGPPDPEGRRPTRAERRFIDRKLRSIARSIETDLLATPNRERLPMVSFQSEYNLSPEESLIVVDLLFAELFEGEPSLEIIELLQMVSHDEEDLLRRRRLLNPGSPLLTRGILLLHDHPEDEREHPPRVSIADWVKDRILGDDSSGRRIVPDERIDFHLYLRDLDSSARFYQDLAGGSDENGPGEKA
ncbi:MAG: hypothetical protein HY286_11270 [Planctomycetes bacterium]|nr:hypothetical protein [Planctomycetota bacterium]